MHMFVADKHAYPLLAIDYPDHYTGWENILARADLVEPAFNKNPPYYPPPGIWHCPRRIFHKVLMHIETMDTTVMA